LLTRLLVDSELAASGKQVKDALANRAVFVNGQAIGAESNADVGSCFQADNALFERFYIVRLGKKKYHLFEIER